MSDQEKVEKVFLCKECTVGDPYRQGLLDALNEQRSEESLCDVILVADDDKFPAHRCILAATSPYFRSMFEADRFCESNNKEIELYSVEKGALKEILNMIYTGKLYLDIANVHCILGAADHMLLNDAKEFCAEFMSMVLKSNSAPAEALKIRRSAELYSLSDLVYESDRLIGSRFHDVVSSEAFYSLSLEEIRRLLGNEDVEEGDESNFWYAAVAWLRYDLHNRFQHVDTVMKNIRFPLIDPQTLITKIQADELIIKSPMCESLVEEAMKYQLLRSSQSKLQSSRTKPRCTEDKTIIYCLAGEERFMCYVVHHNRWYSLLAPQLNSSNMDVDGVFQEQLKFSIVCVNAKVYAYGQERIIGEVSITN